MVFLMFIMRHRCGAGRDRDGDDFRPHAARSRNVQTWSRRTQSVIAILLYFAGMALAVFASAGLVSAVFEPGRIELLLSKPVSRTHLLLGRYVGNVLVMAANILYLVLGSWIIFGIKTDVWGWGFPLSSLCTIFVFRGAAGGARAGGRAWDSAAVAIMATFAIMIMTPILAQKATLERLLVRRCRAMWCGFCTIRPPKTRISASSSGT